MLQNRPRRPDRRRGVGVHGVAADDNIKVSMDSQHPVRPLAERDINPGPSDAAARL
jgi:hypothetical protein